MPRIVFRGLSPLAGLRYFVGMRKLWLLRHAQAEPEVMGHTDFERPLAQAGRLQAMRAGKWLTTREGCACLLLCSPALRARQTCQYLVQASAAGWISEIRIEARIYEASLNELLRLLMDVDAPNLLLIGHNPALEALLAHLLADKMWRVLPPAGLVELELNVKADLRLPGGVKLVAQWNP